MTIPFIVEEAGCHDHDPNFYCEMNDEFYHYHQLPLGTVIKYFDSITQSIKHDIKREE